MLCERFDLIFDECVLYISTTNTGLPVSSCYTNDLYSIKLQWLLRHVLVKSIFTDKVFSYGARYIIPKSWIGFPFQSQTVLVIHVVARFSRIPVVKDVFYYQSRFIPYPVSFFLFIVASSPYKAISLWIKDISNKTFVLYLFYS